MDTKCCSRCKTDKTLDEFNNYKRGTQGKQAYCRPCGLAYQHDRRHDPATSGAVHASDQRRRAKLRQNPDYVAAANERSRRWRSGNRERHAEGNRRWRENNPEAFRLQSSRQRARLWGVEVSLTIDEWLAVLEEHDRRCAYCGDPFEAIDHVVPLSKGGAHSKDNVVPACGACNYRRGDGRGLRGDS